MGLFDFYLLSFIYRLIMLYIASKMLTTNIIILFILTFSKKILPSLIQYSAYG